MPNSSKVNLLPLQTREDLIVRMGGSGGLAAPTAVVSTSRGVQIYIKVTDIDIKTEAFTMVLMVGVVEEIVITKEGVDRGAGSSRACWGALQNHPTHSFCCKTALLVFWPCGWENGPKRAQN